VHAHARGCGQFLPHRSIKCFDLHLWHKYQANPRKTMKLQYIEIYPDLTYLHVCTCMHVHANYFDHAVQLGTSISMYSINLNEFKPRIIKLVLHVFMGKNSNARARACMHFQKKWLSFRTSTNARLWSWKVSCWSLQ
jgi:hypothetical protein